MFNRKKHPKDDPSLLGNLLIATGRCTPAQIQKALQLQRDHKGPVKLRLGGALVQLGYMTFRQIEVARARQKVEREKGNGAVHGLADLAMKRSREVIDSFDTALAAAEKITK